MKVQVDAQLALQKRPEGTLPVMRQRWDELLFLHWKADADELAASLPPGLAIDRFEDDAWIGVVPFRMRNIRPRSLPAVPWISNFLELNVRTYVVDEKGTPGVWFYSLDTDRWIARTLARAFFKLPYFWASMHTSQTPDGSIHYQTSRFGKSHIAEYDYCPSGKPRCTEAGSLDFFLLERYLLYSWDQRNQQLLRGRVWHQPYRIRDVEVSGWDTAPVNWDGLETPSGAPQHQCFVDRVDVDAFAVEAVQ